MGEEDYRVPQSQGTTTEFKITDWTGAGIVCEAAIREAVDATPPTGGLTLLFYARDILLEDVREFVEACGDQEEHERHLAEVDAKLRNDSAFFWWSYKARTNWVRPLHADWRASLEKMLQKMESNFDWRREREPDQSERERITAIANRETDALERIIRARYGE